MDFSAWSLSDTIIVIIVAIGFVVQIAITIYKTNQLARQQHRLQADIDQLRAALRFTWGDSGYEAGVEPTEQMTDKAQENGDERARKAEA